MKEIPKDNVKTMDWHVKAARMIQFQYVTWMECISKA